MDEWIVLDSRSKELSSVYADTQRNAIRKGLEKFGIVPRKTDDVRPRTGTQSIMSTKDFEEFIKSIEI